MQDQVNATPAPKRVPWNKGKLMGAKPPLRPKHVWSIRTKLQLTPHATLLAHIEPAVRSDHLSRHELCFIAREIYCRPSDIIGHTKGNST